MKNELSKKIAAYSAAAGVVFLVANHSEAQIIYTNPPDIHLNGVGAHQSLDLNNDGVADVIAEITTSSSYIDAVIKNIDTDLHPVAGLMYDDCQHYSYGYGLLPMKSGKAIGQELNNIYLTWYRIEYGPVLNWNDDGVTCHRWSGLKKHFAGFAIRTSSGDFNYGWIRLSVNHSGTKVTIHDWAINFELNQPIYAGQTMKIAAEELQPSNDLQIYSSGKQIFINQNSQNLPLEISIYNLLGEEMKHYRSSDENVIIQCDEFSSGIYIVKARSAEKSSSKEVVID